MKKAVISLLLLALSLSALFSCGNDVANPKDNSPAIKFEYFFRGFIPIEDTREVYDNYPLGVWLITSEEDWSDFMNKHLPGIPYSSEPDFKSEFLVACSYFGAKPTCAASHDIESVYLENGEIIVKEADFDTSAGINAMSREGILQVFVNVIKIDNSYLADAKNNNIYIK